MCFKYKIFLLIIFFPTRFWKLQRRQWHATFRGRYKFDCLAFFSSSVVTVKKSLRLLFLGWINSEYLLMYCYCWTYFFSMLLLNYPWNNQKILRFFWWFLGILEKNRWMLPCRVFHKVCMQLNAEFLTTPLQLYIHASFWATHSLHVRCICKFFLPITSLLFPT